MNNLNKNILLNQILIEGETLKIKEVSPFFNQQPPLALCLDKDMNLCWNPFIESLEIEAGYGIDISINQGKIRIDASIDVSSQTIIEDDKLKGTNIYWKEGQIGIGRLPLLSYNFDIATSENQVSTSIHIGDGKSGFSMGNGTSNGFLPEIIGMGKDEYDAGLYLLGRAGNNKASDIPLIILDGRSNSDTQILNRPILGITSAKYDDYKMIINHNGDVGIGKKPKIYKLEVQGKISAEDIILNGISLIEIIKDQEKEIAKLKEQIKKI